MKQYYTANISKPNIDLLYGIGYSEKMIPTFADAFDYLLGKGLIIMVVPARHPDAVVGPDGRAFIENEHCKYYINGDAGSTYNSWHVAADAAIADACRSLLFAK